MKIELHIDELILEGMPSHQRQRVAAAIEQALTKIVTERGLSAKWTQLRNLVVVTQQKKASSRNNVNGRKVAQAILNNLKAASNHPVGSGKIIPAGTSSQDRGK